MKYQQEYRDPETVRRILERIAGETTRRWRIMEVCGGQTHTIVKQAIDQLLPTDIELIHGPGCPVCVTPVGLIDKALEIAARPGVILCTFGDMIRVPGTARDLMTVKAAGGDVRVVYSPLDALGLARANPGTEVVFFAVGFETTAPANAMAVWQADREGIANFSLLVSHVTVPPAIGYLLSQPDARIDAFLAAGHVCTIMGTDEYDEIVGRFRKPMVVTGFEAVDILEGILRCVRQLERGKAELENQYARSVRPEGNAPAVKMIREVFRPADRAWRGIGVIPRSGYALAERFAGFDAELRFGLSERTAGESERCRSGLILQGKIKPPECEAFGRECTPDFPLGAPMVSAEGACAAYYRFARRRAPQSEAAAVES